MKKLINFVKEFIKKEKNNKKSILFWVPFILLIMLSLLIFIIYKVNVVGWLITIILFLIIFIIRNKILLVSITLQIITLLLLLISLTFVFTFTKEKIFINNNTNKEPLREISFNNKYDLIENKGTYEIKLTTNKTDNKYELELTIYSLTSIIPSDFIYDNSKAKSYIREGITIYELDQLESFITSSSIKDDYYSHGPLSIKLDYSSGSPIIIDMFPTNYKFNFNSEKKLNEFINKYDKIEIYIYNIGEVGINNFKSEHNSDGSFYGSYGYNAEKAYKLHPVLLETNINWNDLKVNIELK